MSTLSLEDLGPKMRRELGLEASCHCSSTNLHPVALIPVVEVLGPPKHESCALDGPGAAWLRNGLHRLRVPQHNPRGQPLPATQINRSKRPVHRSRS